MFKRRRPDDPPEGAAGLPVPPPTEAVLTGAGSAAPDNGLDVPPFRPATSAGPNPEQETRMGRPPFAAPTAAAPPAPPAVPPGLPPPPPLPRPPGATAPLGAAGAAPRPAGGPPVREAAPDRRTLVVGRGISVQGTVQDAERLVVEGIVEAGMIHATELSISHGGVFRGEVQVEEAEIAGTIDGTVTARGNLVVRSSGVVLGTARCRRLQVEDGGQITGRIEMLTEQTAKT